MKKQDLKILMLEDEEFDAELNKAQLLLLDEYNCIVDWVVDRKSYLEALENTKYDIVLSDYNLPQYNGLEALNDLKSKKLIVPFIFVTGTIDEETAAGTIKAGAWDYVVKDRLFRLPLAIRSTLQLREERVNTVIAEAKNLQLSMAVEQSPVLVVITDTHYKIEYVNTKFTEVTGFTAEEAIGKDTFMLIPDEKRNYYFEILDNELKKAKSWQGEVQSLKKDKTLFWEHMSISPLINESGETTNYIAVMEDTTKRKKMEEEIIQALDHAERSDKLKEAFLQNLSHEIRTPLNAIIGFSDLLSTNKDKGDKVIDDYTNIIINSSNKLLSIVTDVLTIASIQTGQESVVSQVVDINSVFDRLNKLYMTMISKKKLNFIVKKAIPNGSFYIKTDETKLDQILTNLLNNAIKFTHAGYIELGYEFVNGEKSSLRFYVKDTGIGVPKESHEIIFERFRQAGPSISSNYGGTGLGLSISQSFAKMLGGYISVYSELNQGSVFSLFLHDIVQENFNHLKKSNVSSLDAAPFELLIAEDEINNYLLIEAILSDTNLKLHHVENGLEAFDFCKENPSVSMVLMDIKMPVMDGVSAFKEIKKIRPSLPIIAQTAYALEQEKQEFLNLGFNDYIAKPILRDELLKKIKDLLP
jgi:PAS domain S-box-containing protein